MPEVYYSPVPKCQTGSSEFNDNELIKLFYNQKNRSDRSVFFELFLYLVFNQSVFHCKFDQFRRTVDTKFDHHISAV